MTESNGINDAATGAPPLVVDLDGTLIKSDMLLETFLLLLRKNPLFVFLVPLWLLRGKATLKREIASRVEIEPELLPYTPGFVEYVRGEAGKGRRVVLATASDAHIARPIAEHLGLADVLSSDGETNLSGARKLDAIVRMLGDKRFVYAGNADVDRAIWSHAEGAIAVNATGSAIDAWARSGINFVERFERKPETLRKVVKAIRPHQWAKNLLIFVPMVLAHRILDVTTWIESILAFASFSLLASSVYVTNDLLDIPNDRHHHRKRNRPFAAGDVSILVGFALAAALIVVGFGLSFLLPMRFSAILGLYFVVTTAYSAVLKRLAIIDVLVLASLYTVRIVAGAAATDTVVSYWLQAFSLFVFLNLAFIKRYTELHALLQAGKESTKGRGYRTSDLHQLGSLGSAAGYVAVLVLALYVNSPDVKTLYKNPSVLWGMLPLFLYWVSRLWVIASRGEMHDDPIVFALEDEASYAVAALLGLVVLFAAF